MEKTTKTLEQRIDVVMERHWGAYLDTPAAINSLKDDLIEMVGQYLQERE